MAMSLRRADRLPPAVRAALSLSRAERVLAWGRDEGAGVTVVATNHGLYAVDAPGELTVSRPWHLVDAGTWSADLSQLTVTWVDGSRPAQWVFREPTLLPEAVRERVQASVVLAQRVDLGNQQGARVVIRQDLATGALVEQAVLGRGVREDQPGVAEAVAVAQAYLREQVGLD